MFHEDKVTQTPFGQFMLNNVTSYIEKYILPPNWTSNTLALIGHFYMPLAGLIAILNGGLNFTEVNMPSWVFFFAALCV